jgi:hypothetical protein
MLIATRSSEVRRTRAYEFHLNFARNSSFFLGQIVLGIDEIRRCATECDGVRTDFLVEDAERMTRTCQLALCVSYLSAR